MPLWLVPPLLLIGGGIALFLYARRRGNGLPNAAFVPLTPDEEARLAALTAADPPAEKP